MRLEPRTPALNDAPAPIPILTNTGADASKELSWYLDGLRQFVAEAMACTSDSKWRAKRLFAVPLVGTGDGGQRATKGALTKKILETLESLAEKHDVDIVLVARDEAAYSALQQQRPKTNDLSDELRLAADRLARHARSGELVLFMGAGLSIPAGLRPWRDLLFSVAEELQVPVQRKKVFEEMSVLDLATIIESAASSTTFKEAVSNASKAPLHGLGHALIGSLGVREAVTTNYDQLYEHAVCSIHTDLAVLPDTPRQDGSPWLLKLHGCVTSPSTIVITRQDYVRYQATRSALHGIVQALLITRHILFVGFSLTDDNFHVVVDAVRQAIGGGVNSPYPRKHFGTALFLSDSEVSRNLWKHDIDVIEMSPPGKQSFAARDLEKAPAARNLEKSLLPATLKSFSTISLGKQRAPVLTCLTKRTMNS